MWTLGRTLCCSQSTLLMLLGVFILAHWCGCVCQSAFIFLHLNWCRWKILSTHLKPSGKSLWCLIRSHTSTDICLNCLVQSLPKLIQRNIKEVCMRKYIGNGGTVIAVVRGVSGGRQLVQYQALIMVSKSVCFLLNRDFSDTVAKYQDRLMFPLLSCWLAYAYLKIRIFQCQSLLSICKLKPSLRKEDAGMLLSTWVWQVLAACLTPCSRLSSMVLRQQAQTEALFAIDTLS